VAQAVAAETEPFAQITASLDAALEAFAEERVARISFQDGPAVLGFDEWRAIVEEHSLGLMVAMLANAMEAGDLRRTPPEPLAHIMLGALTEAGMVIASGGEREPLSASLRALLEGLRARG
jgi:hypothetical protein